MGMNGVKKVVESREKFEARNPKQIQLNRKQKKSSKQLRFGIVVLKFLTV